MAENRDTLFLCLCASTDSNNIRQKNLFESGLSNVYNANMSPLLKTLGIAVAVLALIWAIVALSGRQLGPMIDTASTVSATDTFAVGISITPSDSSASSSFIVSSIPLPNPAPASSSITAPSLTRNIAFSPGFSAEAKQIVNGKIAKLRETLSKNPNDYSAWMNLALQYKSAGDYEGAREIWEYISRIYTSEGTALHNMGDLYHHFLNDFAKAEQYYLRSIDVNKAVGMNYMALHELYRYSYKQDTALAADILKNGITNVGGNQVIDMYQALGFYYKEEKNDVANAIVYFTKARDGAEKAGNTALAAQFNDELSALKK